MSEKTGMELLVVGKRGSSPLEKTMRNIKNIEKAKELFLEHWVRRGFKSEGYDGDKNSMGR